MPAIRPSTLGLAAAALVGVAALVSGALLLRRGLPPQGVLLTLALFAQVWFAVKAAREPSVPRFLGVTLLALVSAIGPVPGVGVPMFLAAICAGAAGAQERRRLRTTAEPTE